MKEKYSLRQYLREYLKYKILALVLVLCILWGGVVTIELADNGLLTTDKLKEWLELILIVVGLAIAEVFYNFLEVKKRKRQKG